MCCKIPNSFISRVSQPDTTTDPTLPSQPSTKHTAMKSVFELEIIQPRAGLDTKNRFYKTYPGLPYNVRVAVTGGSYPFIHELTTAPNGMSIDTNSGVINWPNPQLKSTPYDVSLKVTDQEGTVKTVSWTITVTTDKFLFVDASAPSSGGSGTLSDPYTVRSFAEMYRGDAAKIGYYCDKYDEKYKDYFVYFKNGTYEVDGFSFVGASGNSSNCSISGGSEAAGVQYTFRKPAVLMAFPGHKPILNMSKKYINFDSNIDNFYFEGFEVTPLSHSMGVRATGGSHNVTFRNNHFHGLVDKAGSHNQSCIMLSRSGKGKFLSVQNNIFSDITHGYGIIGYSADTVLIEDNLAYDVVNGSGVSHVIGPKLGTTNWFIRSNTIYNTNSDAIWIYSAAAYDQDYGPMEISYNNIISTGRPLYFNGKRESSGKSSFIFRNTFVGGRFLFRGITNQWEDIEVYNNVIINNDNNQYYCSECTSEAPLKFLDNLKGTMNQGVVDSENRLTAPYSEHVGKIGHEI